MPFPGSQQSDTINWAFFIEKYKWLLRIIGLLLIAGTVIRIVQGKRKPAKVMLVIFTILYGIIFFFFNLRFEADKMFYQPTVKNFSNSTGNTIDSNKLVIGIVINGEARAYPIQLIGYHHQVQDTVGRIPVMITYCTVCRTGRVYSPIIKGKHEKFRLVGMDHFNAMFEDESTKSWWQQATGLAIAGPLKGSHLTELPSHQASLSSWLRHYPKSTIMQADTVFKNDYDDLADFDKGTVKSHLEKRDSASWKMKSWVVGLKFNKLEKAYDWNDLVKYFFIQDTMGPHPVLLLLENDTVSFHAFSRNLRGHTLFFIQDKVADLMTDTNTHSIWNGNGHCISGSLKDFQLDTVPAYQEFWHSWKQFHPNTSQYKL
jgi:hypothetical protein